MIGPLWPVMDILTILIAILLIAVMAAATGSIFAQVGLPSFLGNIVVIIAVGILNFFGSGIIEKFESIGTILLYCGYKGDNRFPRNFRVRQGQRHPALSRRDTVSEQKAAAEPS